MRTIALCFVMVALLGACGGSALTVSGEEPATIPDEPLCSVPSDHRVHGCPEECLPLPTDAAVLAVSVDTIPPSGRTFLVPGDGWTMDELGRLCVSYPNSPIGHSVLVYQACE
jgi:hypothetical protein